MVMLLYGRTLLVGSKCSEPRLANTTVLDALWSRCEQYLSSCAAAVYTGRGTARVGYKAPTALKKNPHGRLMKS